MSTETKKSEKSIPRLDDALKERLHYWIESKGAIDMAEHTAKQNGDRYGEAMFSWVSPLFAEMVQIYQVLPDIFDGIEDANHALKILEEILGVRQKDNRELFNERVKELGDIYAEIRLQKERHK